MPVITRSQSKSQPIIKAKTAPAPKTQAKSAPKTTAKCEIYDDADEALQLLQGSYSRVSLETMQQAIKVFKLITKHLNNLIDSFPSDKSKVISACKSAKFNGVCFVNQTLINRIENDFGGNKNIIRNEAILINALFNTLEFAENYQFLLAKKNYTAFNKAFLARSQAILDCCKRHTFDYLIHGNLVALIQGEMFNAGCAYDYAQEI